MRNKTALLIISIVGVCLFSSVVLASTIHVKTDGTGDYTTIQAAIDAAQNGDVVIIAQGQYAGDGNYRVDFKGKRITVQSENPNDPNIVSNTIVNAVSGSIGTGIFTFSKGEDPNSILSGLTLKGVNVSITTNSNPIIEKCIIQNRDTGIYIRQSSPIIRECLIRQNGRGILCIDATPLIVNCVISDNHATGEYGGGIESIGANSNPTIDHCTIEGNSVACWGGGIGCHEYGNAIVKNSLIKANTSGSSGGGIMCREHGRAEIYNCRVEANIAENGGGAMCYVDKISNCLIVNNISVNGGGGISGCKGYIINCTVVGNESGGMSEGGLSCSGIIRNCIAWNNSNQGGINEAAQIQLFGDNPTVDNCCIQGLTGNLGGTGNIADDPLFVDIIGGDFRLDSASPCIDSGDTSIYGEVSLLFTDANGSGRIKDGDGDSVPAVDMGAYEFQNDGGGSLIVGLPSEINFTAFENRENPDSQFLTILNGGNGVLNWQLSTDCDWLSFGNQSGNLTGTETNVVTLSADATGLTKGEYTCNLTISDSGAGNNPQNVLMNFTIIGPILDLSDSQVVFWADEGASNPAPQSLTIVNAGGGILNWSITYDCSWLQLDQVQGSTTINPSEVVLTTDISGLVSGIYTCELCISDTEAENSPQIVIVVLHIRGAEIFVPIDFDTIQSGIDHVIEGGTVYVADGFYTGTGNHHINFNGKPITVMSENGPDNCIIDCRGVQFGTAFQFFSGEDANSILDGFTIQNADTVSIDCSGSAPIIRNCIIQKHGGGIQGTNGACPRIEHCLITKGGQGDEFVSAGAVGIYITETTHQVQIDHCIISENGTAEGIDLSYVEGASISNCLIFDNGGYGGIKYFNFGGPTCVVDHCTIVKNRGDNGGGITLRGEDAVGIVTNCILWGNKGEQITSGQPTVSYSNIQNGFAGIGNSSEDPLFLDPGFIINNAVSYWKLDESFGFIVNDSGYGHHGGTTWDLQTWRPQGGYIGGALEFDGSDDRVTTGYRGITGGHSRTVTAWIKPTQVSGEIIAWGDTPTGSKWIVRVNENGTLRAEVSGGYIYGTTPLNDGIWHHVAVVLDNDGTPDISEVLLYVDGQLDTVGAMLAQPINTAAAQYVTLGVYAATKIRYFKGLMDEVRLYEFGLSAANVQQLYNNGVIGEYGDYHLRWDSPCIDTGQPDYFSEGTDLDDEPRVMNGRTDMGVDEVGPKQADFTRDGLIDFEDFSVLSESWGYTEGEPNWCPQSDLYKDQQVDILDLVILAEDWLWQSDWSM